MAYTTTSASSSGSDSSGVKISVALLGMLLALGAGYVIGGIFPFNQWGKQPPNPEIKQPEMKQPLAGTPQQKPKPGIPQQKPPTAPAQAEPNKIYKVPVGDAPMKGSTTAKVTIIEYSDFQCPFCSRVVPTLDKILTEYPNDVRVIFKQSPLPFHDKAGLAAEAALAAHEQGKFWEMHDKLFENQGALNRSDLEKYAQELGLNMDQFKSALDSGKFKDKISAESSEAATFGVRGTPSFFINGKFFVGAQPFEKFQSVIKEEIQKAEELLKSGVAPTDLYTKITENGLERASIPEPPKVVEQEEDESKKVYQINPGDGPSWGDPSAKITIVEFSDFQCPFCSRVIPTVKKIKDKYPKEVRIIWRNYPLPFHDKAGLAAEAALAAHEQGKFWEMHDKLFENQGALNRSDLEKYAQELGLNMDQFKSALDSGKFKDKISADVSYGNSLPGGGMGTPTFFINGHKLAGAYPFEKFDQVIQQALSEK